MLTNLLSIGDYAPALTGGKYPQFPNAHMMGLSEHNNFEGMLGTCVTFSSSNSNIGDGSQSRQDHYFGEYINFHEPTFNRVRCALLLTG